MIRPRIQTRHFCQFLFAAALSSMGLSMGSSLAFAEEVAVAPSVVERPNASGNDFQQGLKLYDEKKYAEAEASFRKALESHSESPTVLTDLALAEFQAGDKGWALAHLRRAVYLDPGFSTSNQALNFVRSQFEVHEIPHEILWTETWHEKLFSKTSFLLWSMLSALSLVAASSAWIRYFRLRRQAVMTESISPKLPWTGLLSLAICLSTIGLSLLQFLDDSTLRATVGPEKLEILAAPDEKAPMIFEVNAGAEMYVQNSEASWLQVTYPGGLTGWAPNSKMLVTNSKPSQNTAHEKK
jgi:tetratricopeptide (TPR) repeat protein